jgi:hypothetical protein
MRAGDIALATAPHIGKIASNIHDEQKIDVELLLPQDEPPRHRNGITDACILRKACGLDNNKDTTYAGPVAYRRILKPQDRRKIVADPLL